MLTRATAPHDPPSHAVWLSRTDDHPQGGQLDRPGEIEPPGASKDSQDTFGKMGKLAGSSELGTSPRCPRINDPDPGRPLGPPQEAACE